MGKQKAPISNLCVLRNMMSSVTAECPGYASPHYFTHAYASAYIQAITHAPFMP